MRYADLDKYNWNEIQEYYDKTNFMGVVKKFKITTSRLSAAVKRGLFKTRPIPLSRRLSGKNRNKHTPETKEKIRLSMLKAVKEGRQKTLKPYGRACKRIPYKNWLGEEMVLLGGWEEIVAKFLDERKLVWSRPKQGIRYIFENAEHYYFPDFFLNELNLYLEVKGYETEKDREKWRQFPYKLFVINKHNIFNLNEVLMT